MIAAGRPVTDSFGVVKVDEIAGVRVFVNSEEIGKTGADGRLFVPALSSFNDNQISIDVANVPLDFTFPESVRVVSPAYRAGAVVNFHAKRLRAFVGTLMIRIDRQDEARRVLRCHAGRRRQAGHVRHRPRRRVLRGRC